MQFQPPSKFIVCTITSLALGWSLVVSAAAAAPTAEQREQLRAAAKQLTTAEAFYKNSKLTEATAAFETAQKSLVDLAGVKDLSRQLNPLVKRLITLHDKMALDGAKVSAIAAELTAPAAPTGGKVAKSPGRGRNAKGAGAMPPYTGEWVVMSEDVLAELAKSHPANGDPYARLTAGVTVDRTTGDVYLMANNMGICKSTDQGKTFELVSGKTVTGRFEYAAGMDMDPAGGRLMCFSIYGSAGYTGDAGKTWSQSRQGHLDFGAVDWTDTGKAMIAIGHESGGKLLFSEDGGATWKTLGAGYWGTGMFDHNTLVSSTKEGLVRSTDGGATWKKVSDEKLAAAAMVDFEGVGYWLCDNGLMESKDKGATWTVVAPTPKGASLGPMFGNDASQMVVGCPDGLYQSNDGGKTWVAAVPLAPEITVRKGGQFANYGWDPINNIFYASQMSKPAYKFVAKSSTGAAPAK